MNIDFTGKVCLITGASSGIGAGTAELFSKCGATLVLTGRNEENLKKVCEKCVEASPQKLKPLSVIADLGNDEEVEKLVETTIHKLLKIDILINNAGFGRIGTVEGTSLGDFDGIMRVNTRSIFQLTKLCIPHLIKTKGNIVNNSSISSMLGVPALSSYAVSKAALDQFTRCTALELAPKGVRVNAVNPGVIKTEMCLKLSGSEEVCEKYLKENCREMHALGRHGEVKEVASAIVFLASDYASFITGVTLPVDGFIKHF